MKPVFFFFFCTALTALAGTPPPPKPETTPATPGLTVDSRNVVRISSTNQAYDFFRPWTKKPPFSRRGLGAILENNQILTTAELVANSVYVELERPGTAEKSSAEVVQVDYEGNLALLRPTDPKFLEYGVPLQLDSGAKVGDAVEILQLEPNGQMAATPAVITTVTVANYPIDDIALLTFKLSAPIQQRDGSFTLPAVRNGKLVGLLTRYDPRGQTADLIPEPVIAHFLKEVADGNYQGFPRAGVAFAPTRDPQLRKYLGLTENGGVYVTDVLPDSPADKAGMKKGDVITAVGNHSIDQDGNYEHPIYGRIPFSHVTNTVSHAGDTLEFQILRNGEKTTLPIQLAPRDLEKMVSVPYLMDQPPRYYVLGGLIFTELTRPYLQEWGGDWRRAAPERLVYYDAFQNELPRDRGKIVFLSQVLPSNNTLGYENLNHLVVDQVNGVPIKSLDDLAKAAESPIEGFHKVELVEDPGVLFLDAKAVAEEAEQLRQYYGLPALHNLQPPAAAEAAPTPATE